MKPHLLIAHATSVVLLLSACAGANGPSDPNGPPGGTFDGLLVGEGGGYLHTMNLSANGEWQTRQQVSASQDVPALDAASSKVYVAGMSMAEPLLVNVYDLPGFSLSSSIEWPNTEDLFYMSEFAVSPGGRYLAAALEELGEPFLQVLDTETGEVLFSGLQGLLKSNTVWWTTEDDLLLVFATELEGLLATDHFAAIVALPLEELIRVERGEDPTIYVIEFFDLAGWGAQGVSDIALAPDGAQIAYVLNGDIWVDSLVANEAAGQLTTGPTTNAGPAFSPDGNWIVFSGVHTYIAGKTMVVPNDGSGPYLVDINNEDVGQVYTIDHSTMVGGVLGWLP